jgi:hypothetical protein
MKDIYYNIALQVGGSHYPKVGGDLLEKFGDLLVQEILQTINDSPKHCAFTTYDMNMVQCTVNEMTKKVKDKFNV